MIQSVRHFSLWQVTVSATLLTLAITVSATLLTVAITVIATLLAVAITVSVTLLAVAITVNISELQSVAILFKEGGGIIQYFLNYCSRLHSPQLFSL